MQLYFCLQNQTKKRKKKANVTVWGIKGKKDKHAVTRKMYLAVCFNYATLILQSTLPRPNVFASEAKNRYPSLTTSFWLAQCKGHSTNESFWEQKQFFCVWEAQPTSKQLQAVEMILVEI